MNKFMLIAAISLLLVGCGGNAPRQKPKPEEPYVVLSSSTDPTLNRLSIAIKVDPPVTEEAVKQAVEMVIEKHKASYKNITVKSFAIADASGLPYATSYFDGQGITYQFNPQALPQKIPSRRRPLRT